MNNPRHVIWVDQDSFKELKKIANTTWFKKTFYKGVTDKAYFAYVNEHGVVSYLNKNGKFGKLNDKDSAQACENKSDNPLIINLIEQQVAQDFEEVLEVTLSTVGMILGAVALGSLGAISTPLIILGVLGAGIGVLIGEVISMVVFNSCYKPKPYEESNQSSVDSNGPAFSNTYKVEEVKEEKNTKRDTQQLDKIIDESVYMKIGKEYGSKFFKLTPLEVKNNTEYNTPLPTP